ncbi:hypothetical protein [Acinetobacter johnsonii]
MNADQISIKSQGDTTLKGAQTKPKHGAWAVIVVEH